MASITKSKHLKVGVVGGGAFGTAISVLCARSVFSELLVLLSNNNFMYAEITMM